MLEATSKEEPKVYIDLDGRWWCFILSLSLLLFLAPLSTRLPAPVLSMSVNFDWTMRETNLVRRRRRTARKNEME